MMRGWGDTEIGGLGDGVNKETGIRTSGNRETKN
jgi:hypothetical protein